MVTSNDLRIGAIHKATVPPPPPGTGIPQAMPTPPAQGTGIPQAIPTPVAPRMAQGGPPMPPGAGGPPPSGLAGIPPAAPPAPATPDPMQLMGGVALAVLTETSKPTKNIIVKYINL